MMPTLKLYHMFPLNRAAPGIRLDKEEEEEEEESRLISSYE